MDFSSPQFWVPWILTAFGAYLGSYTAEKGKRRAVHQDKDQILDEVAKTTQRLKQIEAAISNDLWERQWRLNQKRDVYARLLESMSELELNVGVLSRLLKMQSTEHLKDELRNYGERVRHVGQDLQRALAVAKVYLPRSAIAAFKDLETELRKPSSELDYLRLCSALARAQEGLTIAAKADLGIEDVNPPSRAM